MKEKYELIVENDANIKDEFKLKQIIGKRILSKDAEVISKVKDVIIKDFNLIGIIFKKGFKTIYLDKKYIESINEKSIMLNVNLSISLLGKQVIDKNGLIVGRVKKVIRKNNSNTLVELIVKKGIFGKEISILNGAISKVSEMIILNKEIDEIK
ncbi:MAG: PRC-barrel domain-containing protein [Candidatus Woesearchaeota archaeon]